MFNNKSLNFIKLNRENFSNENFQIWWLISGMEVIKKKQNFSSVSLKLRLLGYAIKHRDGLGCEYAGDSTPPPPSTSAQVLVIIHGLDSI